MNYKIDTINSDDENCYIDIEGIGSVIIKQNDIGLSIDVYPLAVADSPVFEGLVYFDDLIQGGVK